MHPRRQSKQHAKEGHKAETPYPNIITQVNKEDEKKSHILDFFNIYRCCALFWKCLPAKRQNFNAIAETTPALLEPQLPQFKGKKTLVLDLDETLVHSTFEPVENPDLVLPVRIQGMTYRINVIIRPGTEEFLAKVGELFEVVVFTASLAEYAEPLVKILDTTNAISSLLFRQHCTPLNGIYVKDMSLLGRDIKDIILVDNSPNSFLFQPENAYHIKNFFDDKSDRELIKLSNFLDHMINIEDVRPIDDMRKKYEPQPGDKPVKFFKVQNPEADDLEIESININESGVKPSAKKKEDREKTYNIETEPDLRKDEREEEFIKGKHLFPGGNRDRPVKYGSPRAAPLTERICVDRPFVPDLDSSENIELPSPKESDALINHREADAFFENNSNETETSKKAKSKPVIPPFNKSASNVFNKAEVVTVVDPTIEGHKVEDVRLLTGLNNLNSPLGRHVKIEFQNKNKVEG